MRQPVFRFAPSPNGHLHLGHAYSALLNLKMARAAGGKCLLRIEDIDTQRCTGELEDQMLEDLRWISFEWDEKPRRQSEHFGEYQTAIDKLVELEVLYPSILSRSEIRQIIRDKENSGVIWPRDPDGAPHYPGKERDLSMKQRAQIMQSGQPFSLRLDMKRALQQSKNPLEWTECGLGKTMTVEADPSLWGDVVIARKGLPASYHLCCTVDDALQGITKVVRGMDLYAATSIHILLSDLLELKPPLYHHHRLILDARGNKYSKSRQHESLRDLRTSGLGVNDILSKLGSID